MWRIVCRTAWPTLLPNQLVFHFVSSPPHFVPSLQEVVFGTLDSTFYALSFPLELTLFCLTVCICCPFSVLNHSFVFDSADTFLQVALTLDYIVNSFLHRFTDVVIHELEDIILINFFLFFFSHHLLKLIYSRWGLMKLIWVVKEGVFSSTLGFISFFFP